jgi:uncharacterized protein
MDTNAPVKEIMKLFNGLYIGTMDLYPQESKESNRIYPFYDALRQDRFTTTQCKYCKHRAFPPRVMCPNCLSENLEWVDLPTKGTVLNFTEQQRGVPLGFEEPLIHALIDLGGKMKIFSRIVKCKAGELKEGDAVTLYVFPVERNRVYYAFEPVNKKA